ncbi:uncharacterized protein LOC111687707 [Lucilia cuprina]|uniref:uncharacterized protein LOC111687707 n=1 Tax=Lucilia cuprina TaxID=7375 RepID=UPI001F066C13|nr:uncharacterized protein LOC111687707 [Lucilia cuprina]
MATINVTAGATAAPEETLSKDEVDFVKVSHNNNNNHNLNNNINNLTHNIINNNKVPKTTTNNQQQQNNNSQKPKERLTIFGFSKKSKSLDEQKLAKKDNHKNQEKSDSATTDSGFPCQPTPVPIGTPPRHNKFVKSSSISRLLGNTYNAKKFDKEEKKVSTGKFNTYGGRRRSSGPYLERFKRYAKDDADVASPPVVLIEKTMTNSDTLDSEMLALEHFHESRHDDLGSKAMRTISRGLGKLWWKRTHSVDISSPDPEFKVSYLGNVLTGWAKGEGCVEKQLNTLWRNYTQNNKPDVIMRLKVCASGLKATTRQHGLTEYWANRITHCCAPKNYPRVFCWIYRHEGRKLKHELRCHAVLCSKEKQVQEICDTLKANLECALREFKREKILKQNARLSLANAVYDNPSLPRRKILLSVGSNNYRPPLERSKSAPKLMAIEEAIGEEGEEVEETNEPEMKPCCQKDSLYPAMTLGRRRCRRGHSIRRTGKLRPVSCGSSDSPCCGGKQQQQQQPLALNETKDLKEIDKGKKPGDTNYGSDDSDDFEKILKHNDYDTNASLTNELLPYFERQLNKNISNSCGSLSDLKDEQTVGGAHHEDEGEPLSLLPCINNDPNANPLNDFNPHHLNEHTEEEEAEQLVTMRRAGVCSDGEEDFLGEEEDDMYFRQAAILTMLHRHSMRKMANLSLSSDEGSSSLETNSSSVMETRYKHQQQSSISSEVSSASSTPQQSASKRISNDSADEGSISSGCETASTVTNNQDDLSLKYRQALKQFTNGEIVHDLEGPSSLDSNSLTTEEIFERLQKRNSSDAATTFSSSSSITLKMSSSPRDSLSGLNLNESSPTLSCTNSSISSVQRPRRSRRQRDVKQDSDSECSDESGYVEYQEREMCKSNNNSSSSSSKLEQPKPQLPIKPQIPPKPMPRRFINIHNNATATATIPTTTTV